MNNPEKNDLIFYRLDRAEETLRETKLHIENELWNTAINRMYYACYYAASALLLKDDIKANTHSGVRQMLGLHFIKTGMLGIEMGKVFSDLFDKRLASDYDDFISLSRQDVEDFYPLEQELVKRVDNLLRNN